MTLKIEKNHETKVNKVSKIDKPLATLTKTRRHKFPIIRNEITGITTDPPEIKRVIRECCKQLYKLTNLVTQKKWNSYLKTKNYETQSR